ncbi:MAG: hypothetical protein DSY91_02605, partial [Deltaproteobacteria bacterium]
MAFLEEHQVQTAVNVAEPGDEEALAFYMTEREWALFSSRFEVKLGEISEIFGVPKPRVTVRTISDQAWRDEWKRYARIYRFGRDLIVKPSWRKLRKRPSCPVISIDPQSAFGTGGHASTRLCIYHLLELRRNRPDSMREVIDVGTGSGILAIAASLLGASRVIGTDIDPEAVRVAQENARRNG